MMLDLVRPARRRAVIRLLDAADRGLEPLERRVLLDSAPFPDLAALESANNPVVRLQTTFGEIDLELLANTAPNVVNTFLTNLARYGNTAFTRLVPGEILQAGRALDRDFFMETDHLVRFPAQDTPTRPNTERTVGAVNWGLTPQFITPEFYFNLSDNPQLDAAPNNFIVFARVVDDRSWDVVTTIAGLPTADLDVHMLDPAFFSGPLLDVQGPFNNVPVTEQFNPNQPLARAGLVNISDARLIKPGNVQLFFDNTLYYPEGFISGENIREFVPITNHNDQTVHYQIILRRERVAGPETPRDLIVDTGLIPANSRGGIDLTEAILAVPDAGGFGDEPYAIEIHSTLPITAMLAHYDFGTATGEAFTDRTGNTWTFAEARTGQDLFSFLVWQNTSAQSATIQITFFTGNGNTVNFTAFTPAHQRGGLNLAEVPNLPLGTFGIRMVSDQPIVAALSRYDTRGAIQFGTTELGVRGIGTTAGVIPLAGFAPAGGGSPDPTHGDQVVNFVNTTDSATNVTVTIRPIGVAVAPFTQTFSLGARGIHSMNFEALRNQIGSEDFSVSFTSTQPVVARSAHFQFGDATSTPFSPVAGLTWTFAEGFMDPARAGINVFERLAIYNVTSSQAVTTIIFRFGDGTELVEQFTIAPEGTLVLNLHQFQPLLDQAAAGRNFYGTEIVSSDLIVSQMRRYDLTLGVDTPAGGFDSLGQPVGVLTDLGTGLIAP